MANNPEGILTLWGSFTILIRIGMCLFDIMKMKMSLDSRD